MSSERRTLPVTGEPRSNVDVIADELLDAYLDPQAQEMQHIGSYELPSEQQVENIVEMCRALMFPGYVGPDVARLARPELRDLMLNVLMTTQALAWAGVKRGDVSKTGDLKLSDIQRQ